MWAVHTEAYEVLCIMKLPIELRCSLLQLWLTALAELYVAGHTQAYHLTALLSDRATFPSTDLLYDLS